MAVDIETCPFCVEPVPRGSHRCPHCGQPIRSSSIVEDAGDPPRVDPLAGQRHPSLAGEDIGDAAIFAYFEGEDLHGCPGRKCTSVKLHRDMALSLVTASASPDANRLMREVQGCSSRRSSVQTERQLTVLLFEFPWRHSEKELFAVASANLHSHRP